ncbi:MAG: hypothetical protein EPO21_19235 [Chloroflexota bacterium]|nr:MAG: hypothetical protein EPO21_19235 [Chloroflexota bacterium]
MFDLLTQDGAKIMIRDRMASRDWWIVPWLNRDAGVLSQAIEERHYDGTANADFQILCGGPWAPIFAVSFAHKRHMSASELAKLLVEVGFDGDGRELGRQLEQMDIIAVGDQAEAARRVLAWQSWLSEADRRN